MFIAVIPLIGAICFLFFSGQMELQFKMNMK